MMNCVFFSGRGGSKQPYQTYLRAVSVWTTGHSGGAFHRTAGASLLPCSRGTGEKAPAPPPPKHAKITAHPKSFAAKSIIIITCGDEFPLMVAGPQQPPLIMTFCSCWQSLPVRWLVPNSQRVRQSAHARHRAQPPRHKLQGCLTGRLPTREGRSISSRQHVTFKAIICDILEYNLPEFNIL